MPRILTIRTIRVAANVFEFDKSLSDSNSSASPASWRGNPLKIEIGVFEKTAGDPMDLSQIAEIRVCAKRVRSNAAGFVFYETATIDNALITRDEWTEQTKANASVTVDGSKLDLSEDGADSVKLYMAITAITNEGHEITLEVGTLIIHEDYNIVSDIWRIDTVHGPVFSDGIGWCNASGSPIDGHQQPAEDVSYTYPDSPAMGEYDWNDALRMPVWFDGVGWINMAGVPVDDHELPAPSGSYERPSGAIDGTMDYDETLQIPIWKIGGVWVNAALAEV